MGQTIPIMFISSRANSGAGGERYLYNVMRFLDRDRYEPHVVLPGDGTFREPLEELGVKVHVVDTNHGWLRMPGNWYRLMGSLQDKVNEIKDLIEKYGIQLVHTNSNIRLEGMFAANLAGVHHLYAARVDFQPELEIFQRLGLQRDTFARLMGDLSTKVLSVSRAVADQLSPPIDSEMIQVINNGLDLDDFEPVLEGRDGSVREKLGLHKDDIMILAAGRVSPDKGFDTYLLAAAELVAKYPNAHFLIAGKIENPKYQEDLQSIASENGMEANIHFLGFREDIHDLLAESDVFVLSSRREGQSNVLLEALACRCAVVATRCSGVEEVIRPGATGFIVEIEDAQAMAEKIGLLAKDRQTRESLALAGRTLIETDFRLQSKINDLMNLYDEVRLLPPPKAGSPTVHLFIQQAKEIGSLGERLEDVDERLRQVEQFKGRLTNNPLARLFRKVIAK